MGFVRVANRESRHRDRCSPQTRRSLGRFRKPPALLKKGWRSPARRQRSGNRFHPAGTDLRIHPVGTPRRSSTGLRCSRPGTPLHRSIPGKVGNIPLRSTGHLPDSTAGQHPPHSRPGDPRSKSWSRMDRSRHLDPCSRFGEIRSIRPAGCHFRSSTCSRPLDALSSKQVSSVTQATNGALERTPGPCGEATRGRLGEKGETHRVFEKVRRGIDMIPTTIWGGMGVVSCHVAYPPGLAASLGVKKT